MNIQTYQHLLRTKNEKFWELSGEKTALSIFHYAAERVPAYRHFLGQHGVDHNKIKTIDQFKRYVPVTDKENYISVYSLADRAWNGRLEHGSVIAQSSGTTGKPNFWPRSKYHTAQAVFIHDVLYREFYRADKKKTLFVDCFHLGSHIAGMIMASVTETLVEQYGQSTLVTPGLHKEDILSYIKTVAPEFDQVVMMGYPPFIKDLIWEAEQKGIVWKDVHVKFLFAAEAFPESWREYVCQKVGMLNQFTDSLNIYGSADIGFMAHETPITIAIRKQIEKKDVSIGLMSIDHTPALFQYHPWLRYFEQVENEIVFTANGGVPLIRYNIHDRGEVVSYSKLPQSVALGFDMEIVKKTWQLPFIFIHGRSNYSVTLYGLNIYPEHIQTILADKNIIDLVSGKFFMQTICDEDNNQILCLHIELLPLVSVTDGFQKQMVSLLFFGLRNINGEYKKLTDVVSEKAKPRVYLYPSGSDEFRTKKMKYKYILT